MLSGVDAPMRTHADPKLDLLARVPLFAPLSRRELEWVASVSDVLDVDAGLDLTSEGQLGREVFVLLDGGAAVHRRCQVVACLEAGAVFGELAVLGGGRRTATVTTTAPSRLLVFAGHEFRRVVRELPRVAAGLLPEVARRIAA
jgi:CRP/FNR family cyclic AMP-dependent transcriptional regulator